MEDFYTMSGSTIPPFGNWDYSDELSYTHNFSCAAEAAAGFNSYSPYRADGDLYAVNSSQWRPYDGTPSKKKVGMEHRKQKMRKGYNVRQHKQQPVQKPSLKQHRTNFISEIGRGEAKCRFAKPVDEDLYKIPPELIHAYKRKKMVGFFSRLLPSCIR